MKLSVVIPAHNEEGCIESTVQSLHSNLQESRIDHEILVVNSRRASPRCASSTMFRRTASGSPSARVLRVFRVTWSRFTWPTLPIRPRLERENVDCVFGSNRKTGVSKLKIKEMGSRYLFIVLYCFIEKLFSREDYRAVEKAATRAR